MERVVICSTFTFGFCGMSDTFNFKKNLCASSQELLCTEDEDPIAGIELDSVHHDDPAAMERDAMKDKLFAIAGVPLVRIRAEDTSNVRAEDFYELLLAQSETLGELRPRQLQPRRNHDTLIPAGSRARRAAVLSR